MNIAIIGYAIILFSLYLMFFIFIKLEPRKIYYESFKYQNYIIKGLTDYNLLTNPNIKIKTINCGTDALSKCIYDNIGELYDSKGKLLTNTIIYYLNNDLSFDITQNEWYKNSDNIKDLYLKTLALIYLPDKPVLSRISHYSFVIHNFKNANELYNYFLTKTQNIVLNK